MRWEVPTEEAATGRISDVALEQRCCLSRESFSNFQLVFLRRHESAFLLLYLFTPSPFVSISVATLYRSITVYNIPSRNASGSIRLTLGFPNSFRYCSRGCLSVTALSSIRLLRKNEVVEPKWISQRAFALQEIERIGCSGKV